MQNRYLLRKYTNAAAELPGHVLIVLALPAPHFDAIGRLFFVEIILHLGLDGPLRVRLIDHAVATANICL